MRGPIDFLSRAEPRAGDSTGADALFALAGAQEREAFTADAWRRGTARTLVLSVGRFDWRRYRSLGLPGGDALRAAVDAVPYRRRHFLVVVEGAEAEIVSIGRRRFGTRHELRCLARLAAERRWRAIVVATSAFHLRRTSLAARRIFRGSGVSIAYLAVPRDLDRYAPGVWRRTFRGVRVVASEFVKLAVYALFLGR
ncbi:MAG TPA: hypothetical protein VF363_00270 [Candidatus Eisenbacteria bacterium]